MRFFCLTHGMEMGDPTPGRCVLPQWSDEEQRIVGFYYPREERP